MRHMHRTHLNLWETLATPEQLDSLERAARQRKWALALILVGWLHLLSFLLCYYLTIIEEYHDAPGYLAVWVAELIGVGLIVAACAGRRPAPLPALARVVARIWLAYFVLALNLGSMNALRAHGRFELFPALASLASFGFVMMAMVVNRWFFAAVLVMFASGLLMSAFFLHAYLIFALAWWLVLNGIGLAVLRGGQFSHPDPSGRKSRRVSTIPASTSAHGRRS